MSISVVLVDEHAIVRAAVSAWLAVQPTVQVRGEAGNAREALYLVREHCPHVLVVDWHLEQKGSCLDAACEEMRALLQGVAQSSPRTRVLVLTTGGEAMRHRDMVLWGARGLVLKEAPPETLRRAIEKVHEGELWLERTLLADVVHGLRAPRSLDPEQESTASLTRREREMVALVGAGKSNRAIAESLFITETTVRHHLTAAFAKLGVKGRLECALFALKHSISSSQD